MSLQPRWSARKTGSGWKANEMQSPWEPEASSGGREKPQGGDKVEGVKAKGKWGTRQNEA